MQIRLCLDHHHLYHHHHVVVSLQQDSIHDAATVNINPISNKCSLLRLLLLLFCFTVTPIISTRAAPIGNEGATSGSSADNHPSSNTKMNILIHHHHQRQQQLNKRLFLRELDHHEQVMGVDVNVLRKGISNHNHNNSVKSDYEEEEEEEEYSRNSHQFNEIKSSRSRISSSSSMLMSGSAGGPGSKPPQCISRCGNCRPCVAVRVPVRRRAAPDASEYYPEAWRCKCGGKLYMP